MPSINMELKSGVYHFAMRGGNSLNSLSLKFHNRNLEMLMMELSFNKAFGTT